MVLLAPLSCARLRQPLPFDLLVSYPHLTASVAASATSPGEKPGRSSSALAPPPTLNRSVLHYHLPVAAVGMQAATVTAHQAGA